MENNSLATNGERISPGSRVVGAKPSKDIDKSIVDTTCEFNGLGNAKQESQVSAAYKASPLKTLATTSSTTDSNIPNSRVKFELEQIFPQRTFPAKIKENAGKFNLYEASIESVRVTRKTVVGGGQHLPRRKISFERLRSQSLDKVKAQKSQSSDLPDVPDCKELATARREFPLSFEATSITVQKNAQGNIRVAGKNWSSIDPDQNGQIYLYLSSLSGGLPPSEINSDKTSSKLASLLLAGNQRGQKSQTTLASFSTALHTQFRNYQSSQIQSLEQIYNEDQRFSSGTAFHSGTDQGTVKIKSRRESIAETQEQLKIKRLPEVLESSDESEESSGEFDNLSSEVTPSSSPRNIFNPMEKFEMAKLKNSLYRLGRPLISNEDDRKLWKTIFSTLNDTTQNSSQFMQPKTNQAFDFSQITDTQNNPTQNMGIDLCNSEHNFMKATIEENEFGETEATLKRSSANKSASTTTSSCYEEGISFPPADDVPFDDDNLQISPTNDMKTNYDIIINDVTSSSSPFNDATSPSEMIIDGLNSCNSSINNNNRMLNHNYNTGELPSPLSDDCPMQTPEQRCCFLHMEDVSPFVVFNDMSDNIGSRSLNSSLDDLDSSSPSLADTHLFNSSNDLLSSPSPSPSPTHSSQSSIPDSGPNRLKTPGHSHGARNISSNNFYQPQSFGDTCAVRGAPVDALIAYATQADSQDWRFYEAFLTTYRTFISVEDLLRRLIQRYKYFHCLDSQLGVWQRISKNCFFLIIRISWEIRSVKESELVREILKEFQAFLISQGEFSDSRLLNDFVDRKLSEQIEAVDSTPVNDRIAKPTFQNSKCKPVLSYKAKEIAEQLTLFSFKLFQKIDLPEVLAWAKEFRADLMPNVVAFTEHWNSLSNWAATSILTEEDKHQREKTYRKLVKVVKYLFILNNFSSCFAVLCGLNLNVVSRLDWPKSCLETLSDFSELLSPFNHFKKYRELLHRAKGACIPHLAVVLHDLQQISVMDNCLYDCTDSSRSGSSSSQSDEPIFDVINFSKRWHQYLCLVKLRDNWSSNYYFKENPDLVQFFAQIDGGLSETELLDLSYRIKPRRANYV